MFHQLLSRPWVSGLFFLSAGAAADVTVPGTWCRLGVDLIAPSEIKSGRSAIFLIKLENRSCDTLNLRVRYRLADNSTLRKRTYPKPSRVLNPGPPIGPTLIWNEVALGSGRTVLFEVGAKIRGPGDELRTTQVCASSFDAEDFACEDFQFRVLP